MSGNFFTASDASKFGETSIVVLREISMIQEAIINAVSCNPVGSCTKNCVTIEGNTPMTYYGVIESILISDGGQDYQPIVAEAEFVNTGTGTGSGALASLTVTDGVITDVTVDAGGSNYVDGETDIVINHPQGEEFEATVSVLFGEVTDVTILNGGFGYEPLYPEIRTVNGDGGTGAVLIPEINLSTGEITSVTVEDGGKGYGPNTEINVIPAPTSPGTGAQLSATISSPPLENVDPYKYYQYLNDQTSSCGAKQHVNQILSYFRSKGYTISAIVNPDTNKTILWEVCWC